MTEAYYRESKKEMKRMEKEMALTEQENQECAFHPQLVSNYCPDYLKEMNFLERSYMWKKRVELKLENQRKAKTHIEETDPLQEINHNMMHIDNNLRQERCSAPFSKSQKLNLNIAEELNSFFNLKPEADIQHRKLRNKYLY